MAGDVQVAPSYRSLFGAVASTIPSLPGCFVNPAARVAMMRLGRRTNLEFGICLDSGLLHVVRGVDVAASWCPDADGALWALQKPHQDVLLTIVNAKGWTDERHVDCIGAAVSTANQNASNGVSRGYMGNNLNIMALMTSYRYCNLVKKVAKMYYQ
jgi:hypothetical protein